MTRREGRSDDLRNDSSRGRSQLHTTLVSQGKCPAGSECEISPESEPRMVFVLLFCFLSFSGKHCVARQSRSSYSAGVLTASLGPKGGSPQVALLPVAPRIQR